MRGKESEMREGDKGGVEESGMRQVLGETERRVPHLALYGSVPVTHARTHKNTFRRHTNTHLQKDTHSERTNQIVFVICFVNNTCRNAYLWALPNNAEKNVRIIER